MLRLAGTVNYKTGEYARILEADLRLPAYPIRTLVGDLPDPAPRTPPGNDKRAAAEHRARRTRTSGSARRSTSNGSPASTCRAAGSCPVPPRGMPIATRRARSAPTPSQGWWCHSGVVRRARRDLRPGVRPARRPATGPSCAATRSSAPAPMSPTSSATSTDPPNRKGARPCSTPSPPPHSADRDRAGAAAGRAQARQHPPHARRRAQGPAAPARAHARRARPRPARAPARLPAVRGAAVGARLRPRPAARCSTPARSAPTSSTSPTSSARSHHANGDGSPTSSRDDDHHAPRRTGSSSSASATRSTRRWPATTAARTPARRSRAEQARSLVALLLGCPTDAVDAPAQLDAADRRRPPHDHGHARLTRPPAGRTSDRGHRVKAGTACPAPTVRAPGPRSPIVTRR